jgi:hypothetical protein
MIGGKRKSVTLGERIFTVRELTVAEMDDWFAWLEGLDEHSEPLDVIGGTVLGDISLRELGRLCDCDPALLRVYTPTELQALVEAAREVCPYFFETRAKLARLADTYRSASSAAV